MSTKSQKQQQLHVLVQMAASAMAAPCTIKLLLFAVPLGLGFALGIVATLSLVSSTTPGAALRLFFPPAGANLSDAAAVPPEHPPESSVQAGRLTTRAQSPPPLPVDPAGIISIATNKPVIKEERLPLDVVGGDDDEELMARAAAAPREAAGSRPPKVAFLFLAKWDLPMAPLWENFFRGHRGRYSVYVHTDPAFNGSFGGPDDDDESSAFYRRRIPSKEVKWGHISMVEAERRLLAHALLDASNARFVLLSESHVPLFDFPTVHSYLVNSTASYVESYDEPGGAGRGRYKRGMGSAGIALGHWRKGSQWFELGRALAAEVVSDGAYFPAFKRFCKRNCYADEHYLPTLLNVRNRTAECAGRSVTWVDWSHGGPHPSRFTRMEVTVDFLRWLRNGGGRTCDYNGRNTTVCFLFARKFLPNSLTRFLRFAPKVMGFG